MPEDNYAAIFGGLKDGAVKNQAEIAKAIQELKALTYQFQASATSLPRSVSDKVKGELAGAVSQAVNDAADRIIEKHTAANVQAVEAERAYASAVQWSFMRLFAVGLVFFAAGIGGMVATAKVILLDYETLTSLQREKMRLEQVIAELERRGGRAVLTDCDDNGRPRRCIRTDEKGNQNLRGRGATYRVIDGY